MIMWDMYVVHEHIMVIELFFVILQHTQTHIICMFLIQYLSTVYNTHSDHVRCTVHEWLVTVWIMCWWVLIIWVMYGCVETVRGMHGQTLQHTVGQDQYRHFSTSVYSKILWLHDDLEWQLITVQYNN